MKPSSSTATKLHDASISGHVRAFIKKIQLNEQPYSQGELTQGLILQDEVLDVLYWWRQICSLLLGLLWGAIPLTGWWSFAM
jgi:EMC6